MEPFVHAHAVKSAESLLRFLDDWHGDGVIRNALHHLMVQDEAVLVLDHAHTQAELHRNAGLALADPLCMRLEQGEDLLLVRNVLALQHPTFNLVDLPLGEPHELVELPQEDLRQHDVLELAAGVARPIQVDLRLLEIGAVRLSHRRFLVLTLDLVLRGGVPELLCVPVELLELTQVERALAPVAQAMGLAQIRRDLDGLAYRIPKQIDVGRVVHVRLNDKGVTASLEAFCWTFFYQHVPGLDHLLIDAIKDLGREQAKVVLERLQLVFRLVGPVAVTQHLTQRAVLIDQVVDAVVVGIQAQPHDTEHEDPPLLHPRSTRARIGLALACGALRYDSPQDGEDTLTQIRQRIDVLQPAQQLRNVVPRFRVQTDCANVYFVEHQLRIDHIAHGVFVRRSFWANDREDGFDEATEVRRHL